MKLKSRGVESGARVFKRCQDSQAYLESKNYIYRSISRVCRFGKQTSRVMKRGDSSWSLLGQARHRRLKLKTAKFRSCECVFFQGPKRSISMVEYTEAIIV